MAQAMYMVILYVYYITCKVTPKSLQCQGQTHLSYDSESFLQERMRMDSENNTMRFSNLCARIRKLIQIQKLL